MKTKTIFFFFLAISAVSLGCGRNAAKVLLAPPSSLVGGIAGAAKGVATVPLTAGIIASASGSKLNDSEIASVFLLSPVMAPAGFFDGAASGCEWALDTEH